METAVCAHILREKAEAYKLSHRKTSFLGVAGIYLADRVGNLETSIASSIKGHIPKILYKYSTEYQNKQRQIQEQLTERERIRSIREKIGTLPQIIDEVISPFEAANETNSEIDEADREYVTGAITKKLTVEHVEDAENPGEKKLKISIERQRSLGNSMVDTVSSFTIDEVSRTNQMRNGAKTVNNEIVLSYAHNCPNTLNIEDFGLTIRGNITDGFNITEYQNRHPLVRSNVDLMKPEIDEVCTLLTGGFLNIADQVQKLTVNFDSAGANYDFVSTDTRQSFRSSDLK